ncbi:hypothetical protein [Mangrovibacterium sp.]|uniref:hypothetical protein n=1 Tax=Mangrovibacterium sp. TaxID=1961364 RepID=UPI0035669324
MDWITDKQQHYTAGLWIMRLAAFVGYGFLILGKPITFLVWNPAWMTFTLLLAALKELLWDKWLKKGTPDWDDFWATAQGAIDGMSLLINRHPGMVVFPFKFSKRFSAITLGPVGVFVNPERINSRIIINHERIHWEQQRKHWYLFFYLRYFVEWIFKGYRNISYELEAYANERDFDYHP